MPNARRPPESANTEQLELTGEDPDLIALGVRLRSLRRDAGLTQEALAHAAGLHWTYVGQIERGTRNPTYRNLLKLARGLDVPLEDLVRTTPT